MNSITVTDGATNGFGLGNLDNPILRGIYEWSVRAAGGTLAALNGIRIEDVQFPENLLVDDGQIVSLEKFAGVDLADGQSVTNGFGARDNTTTPGGAGTVYFDAIRIYPCRPGGLAADLNGDCVVDLADLSIFLDGWLDKKLWP